jgi:hypothetical protein
MAAHGAPRLIFTTVLSNVIRTMLIIVRVLHACQNAACFGEIHPSFKTGRVRCDQPEGKGTQLSSAHAQFNLSSINPSTPDSERAGHSVPRPDLKPPLAKGRKPRLLSLPRPFPSAASHGSHREIPPGPGAGGSLPPGGGLERAGVGARRRGGRRVGAWWRHRGAPRAAAGRRQVHQLRRAAEGQRALLRARRLLLQLPTRRAGQPLLPRLLRHHPLPRLAHLPPPVLTASARRRIYLVTPTHAVDWREEIVHLPFRLLPVFPCSSSPSCLAKMIGSGIKLSNFTSSVRSCKSKMIYSLFMDA